MVKRQDNFGTFTILMVDAQLTTRRILRDMLYQFGVRMIVESHDVADAWDQFRQRPVDIVFMDLDCGGPSGGLHLLRQVRDQHHSPDPFVPVIVMGQQADCRTVITARDCGAHEFLVKPISMDMVLRRLQSVTLRPRPFVQTPTYFGPERRRQRRTPPEGQERRWEGSLPGAH